MAGRGGFEAITPADAERLLAQPYAERWDFTADGMEAVFGIPMDKAWVAIHRALSDRTLYGTLGEPPLDMAVLGDHLICQTPVDDFLYLKHPPEVADIAQELARLSRQEFEERLAALPEADEDMEALGLSLVTDEIEYAWPYFEDMRAFYRRAAAEGLAVLFSWG
jgi:Domain of unknown function (DUF1877)